MHRYRWMFAPLVVLACLSLVWLGGKSTSRAAPRDPAPYVLYHPQFVKNLSATNSSLQLDNTAAQTAHITLTLYGGGTLYQSVQTINPASVLVISATDLIAPPNGVYGAIVESDQPLDSLVRTQRSTGEDPLAIYRGRSDLATAHFFGPYLKGTFASTVALFNPNSTAASVYATFRNANGTSAYEQMYIVPANGVLSLYAGSISSLPTGFGGALQIKSDQPIVGNLFQVRLSPYDLEAYPDPGPAALRAASARAFKSVDEGSGPRTTVLYVGNPFTATTNIILNLYDASGSPVYSQLYGLPANGSATLDLAAVSTLPAGRYSVMLAADQAEVLGSYTYHPSAALYPVGDYEIDTPSTILRLPYLTSNPNGHTVVNLQNVGVANATGTISYFTNSGTFVTSQDFGSIKPGQALPLDQGSAAALGVAYTGYAIVTASQPVQAVVDEYLVPPCVAPKNIQISQTPPGIIYTYTPITFTASASGTLPFSYTWAVAGQPINVNASVLPGQFIESGQFTLSLTVTNQCGAGYAELPLTVQQLPPDLSLSYKSVNLTHVGNGDILTYTLMLHNLNGITATALLTDPVPLNTDYVAASINASGGVMTYTANEMRWQGVIVSGTQVVLQYAVQVTSTGLAPGDRITNTAQLDDGLGNLRSLTAVSIFDPGFRLSINNGDLYTNLPTTTLALSWQNEAPPITQMQLSNDGGFASGTNWISVNAHYGSWVLSTYGQLQLPRLVYARFRDGTGSIYGPIQDDIIYDPIPPQINQVAIVSQTAALAPQHNIIVRVFSSDDNSGIAAVQLSDRLDFATYQSFTATGASTDVPRTLPPSGFVYIRVKDRAGNLSTVYMLDGPGDHDVFLPVVLKQ